MSRDNGRDRVDRTVAAWAGVQRLVESLRTVEIIVKELAKYNDD